MAKCARDPCVCKVYMSIINLFRAINDITQTIMLPEGPGLDKARR